jgi:formylglycine-generating enzyme required for sulfatase activity/predicted Ser/Thr protein kinase
MSLSTGDILHNGRYRIDKLLGHGGFGEVYKAWDQILDGYCSVKRNLSLKPEVHRQFQQEAKMLFRLRQSGLPKVYDYFEELDQEQYLVMEFIEGEDLGSLIGRSGSIPVEQALQWIRQVGEALIYLHSRQPPIIHRDIKPGNIILTPEGQVVLVDFGIAKVGDIGVMTVSGAYGQSSGYSPPEQYTPAGTNAQSDVYALGATAYTLLTGRIPEDAILRSLQENEPMPLAHQLNTQVPETVSQAIETAMYLKRSERTNSVQEFLDGILNKERPVNQPMPTQRHEKSPVVIIPEPDQLIKISLNQSYEKIDSDNDQPLPIHVEAKESVLEIPEPVQQNDQIIEISDEKENSVVNQPLPIQSEIFAPNIEIVEPAPIIELHPDRIPEKRTRTYIEPELICIPSGEFLMGSNKKKDSQAYENEFPQHIIQLPEFWIAKNPVTNDEYRLFLKANPEQRKPVYWDNLEFPIGKERHPVVCITWHEAIAFCQWLSTCTGKNYYLPSEAEWEKTARGVDGRFYPWGNSWDNKCCNTNETGLMNTTPVGKYSKKGDSPYGCVDMAGNVWEWTRSLWGDEFAEPDYFYPYRPDDGREKKGLFEESFRILRGGSFFDIARFARCSFRYRSLPNNWNWNSGFRVVSSP